MLIIIIIIALHSTKFSTFFTVYDVQTFSTGRQNRQFSDPKGELGAMNIKN